MAPPCEELDPATIFFPLFHCELRVIIYRCHDIQLVFEQKITFVLRKINKSCCHQSCTFYSNMHQIVCQLGLRPRPTGGAYSAPPDPVDVFRGLLVKGGWLGSRVVSVLDSGAERPGYKSQSRTVLGKLFTPIVPLFTKQQNW